jgi:hypothetical protein
VVPVGILSKSVATGVTVKLSPLQIALVSLLIIGLGLTVMVYTDCEEHPPEVPVTVIVPEIEAEVALVEVKELMALTDPFPPKPIAVLLLLQL